MTLKLFLIFTVARSVEMTGHPVPLFDLLKQRFDNGALAERLRAMRVQPATTRRIERSWHLTPQHNALPPRFDGAIRHGHRRQQRLGIGMQR
jgi:hypothetical protein